MKRYIFIAVVVCLAWQSTAEAQRGGLLRDVVREVGGQFIEQQLRGIQQGRNPNPFPPQQGGEMRPVQGFGSSAIPSEGGKGSGGGDLGFQPDSGFLFERNQPGLVQPRPRYVQPQPQPQPQIVDGRLLYTDGMKQPYVDSGFLVNPQPSFSTQPVVTRSVSTAGVLPNSPVMSNQYVVIRCPDKILGSIHYTLKSPQGNYGFTMSGGQEQRFKVDTSWTMSYNDGSTQRRYALRGGMTYSLKRRSDNGWQLYMEKSPGS